MNTDIGMQGPYKVCKKSPKKIIKSTKKTQSVRYSFSDFSKLEPEGKTENESATESDTSTSQTPKSKFFTRSPDDAELLTAPDINFTSVSAKKIQKDVLWQQVTGNKQANQPNPPSNPLKRTNASPGDDQRRIRSRSIGNYSSQ